MAFFTTADIQGDYYGFWKTDRNKVSTFRRCGKKITLERIRESIETGKFWLTKRRLIIMVPTMLSVKDIAVILKVSYDSALEFIKHSGIDYIKVGRQYRVSEEKLTVYLQQQGQIVVDFLEDYR